MANKVSPALDCEAGLLIGYNCQQALFQKEILFGEENHPYAQRTDLGWSIVGCSYPADDYSGAIGVSHITLVHPVMPTVKPTIKLKKEVHFVCRTLARDVLPTDKIRALNFDFTDHCAGYNTVSEEDILFLYKIREGVKHNADRHLKFLFPFKTEYPNLPDNKQYAIHRLFSLEGRLRRNKQYYEDYVHFLSDFISRKDAEKVPRSELDKKIEKNQHGTFRTMECTTHTNQGRLVWFLIVRNASKRPL